MLKFLAIVAAYLGGVQSTIGCIVAWQICQIVKTPGTGSGAIGLVVMGLPLAVVDILLGICLVFPGLTTTSPIPSVIVAIGLVFLLGSQILMFGSEAVGRHLNVDWHKPIIAGGALLAVGLAANGILSIV